LPPFTRKVYSSRPLPAGSGHQPAAKQAGSRQQAAGNTKQAAGSNDRQRRRASGLRCKSMSRLHTSCKTCADHPHCSQIRHWPLPELLQPLTFQKDAPTSHPQAPSRSVAITVPIPQAPTAAAERRKHTVFHVRQQSRRLWPGALMCSCCTMATVW